LDRFSDAGPDEQSFGITSLPNAFSLKTCRQCHVTQTIAKRERGHRMKMLAEYLENAIKFEQMAAEEKDFKLGNLSRLFVLDPKQPSDAGKSQGQHDRFTAELIDARFSLLPREGRRF
jgi:hypothetical protein